MHVQCYVEVAGAKQKRHLINALANHRDEENILFKP